MKTLSLFLLAVLSAPLVAGSQTITPTGTGLPGDNFSLEGALELFKTSASPEAFEKMLNSEDSKVNNLDLNGDGEIDYIRVVNRNESNAQVFILQAIVSESESQDIAVIELEKDSDDKATVQIVGDEDIYGEQTIIEPTEQVAVNAGTSQKTVVVNVIAWPMIHYVYSPGYVVWVSPWHWHVYPMWWRPWRPVHYPVFYGYHAPYRSRYTVVHTHRVVHAHRIYTPARTTSVSVRTRNEPAITHYRATRPAGTRPSTAVKDQNTRERKRSTTTTTTVNGKRGREVNRSTTTTVGKEKGNTPKRTTTRQTTRTKRAQD